MEPAPPGRPSPCPKTKAECPVTFEEDKLAILPLIGSVDECGQAPPELANGHRVSVHHLVVPYPPEPALLGGSQGGKSTLYPVVQSSGSAPEALPASRSGASCPPNQPTSFAHLEDKHLPSEHSYSVKVPVTDVGPIGGVFRLIRWGGPGGSPGLWGHLGGGP